MINLIATVAFFINILAFISFILMTHTVVFKGEFFKSANKTLFWYGFLFGVNFLFFTITIIEILGVR
jgi:hypothetical protein